MTNDNADRQRKWRQKQRERGYMRVVDWVPPTQANAFRAYAVELRNETPDGVSSACLRTIKYIVAVLPKLKPEHHNGNTVAQIDAAIAAITSAKLMTDSEADKSALNTLLEFIQGARDGVSKAMLERIDFRNL